ncbi:MAG TPA: Flp family type IVb pilin [Symbiobacteriaceae bacterium]|nr:Flp family type IVb pilin [Symbiobacteriaceae bacterium]
MLSLYVKVRNLLDSEKGQGMVEYSMIIGLVAVGVLLLLGAMGTQVATIFQRIVTSLGGAVPVTPAGP